MATYPITEFSITGLHGERNITIPFTGPVKILVGENGAGKTTVLNAMYALISGSFNKLRKLTFEKIEIKFTSGKEVTLKKSDFALDFKNVPPTGFFQHFKNGLSLDHVQDLYEAHKYLPRQNLIISGIYQEAKKRFGVDDNNMIGWLDALSRELSAVPLYSEILLASQKTIHEEFPYDLIYLPTYRRIEEDLKDLGENPTSGIIAPNIIQFGTNIQFGTSAVTPTRTLPQTAIQFGMHDVRARFTSITSEIKESSLQWFAKVSGQMLGQLIGGFDVTDSLKRSLDRDALRIVLDRIGTNMPQDDKAKILHLMETSEIFEGHDPLVYFIANLVTVYEQQKENDNAIKTFAKISNNYLGTKEVVYDESAVEISVIQKKNKKIVDIDTLSSGEKQVISLFSRLFLQKKKSFAIFFDEPELSLSIEWQKTLLPDIMQSDLCAFLFCTTHSPFIFDNELSKDASDLSLYSEEL